MLKKITSLIARWLFVLAVPILLISASIAIAVNSLWLYNAGFEKYGISAYTGLSDSELDKAARGLIDYFNSGEEYIDVTVSKGGSSFELFNEREQLHLKDVKDLFLLDYGMLAGSLVYVLGFAGIAAWKRRKSLLGQGLFFGGGLTLALMFLLGLGIAIGFEQLFWQFHLLSFANDFWLLDPTKDYLIMLFPEGFWFDVTAFVALLTAALAVTLGITGFWLRKVPKASPG